MDFSRTARFFADNLPNKSFRGFDVISVGLIAEHGKEFIVCGNNCAFSETREHIFADIVNVYSNRFASYKRHPRRDIETNLVHLLNEPVNPFDDDVDCSIKQIDYGVPYALENVLDSLPSLIKISGEDTGNKLD